MACCQLFFVLVFVTGYVIGGPIDQHATQLTKNLFNNLKKLASDPNKILFGQHKANLMGAEGGHAPYKLHPHDSHVVGWEFTKDMANKRSDDELCDVKHMTGEFPAFTGYDFYQMDDNWVEIITHVTKKSYNRGSVVAMSWHVHNFADGGDPWHWSGTEKHMVRQLLPGGKHEHHFKAILDKIASWANNLKDAQGRHIPIIFRPFHESNGKWFWWGLGNSAENTAKDLQDIYRYTVKYLRDTKGVHNFLYAFSPNSGYTSMMVDGSQKAYMAAYPGDGYVDILGFDDYNLVLKPSRKRFVDAVAEIVKMAEMRGKIPALTEIGGSENAINKKEHYNFWIDGVLNPLKGVGVNVDASVRRIAYINTWTNQCYGNCKLFTPYKGHPAEKYFVNFYKDPLVLFGNYVKQHNMYA